MIKWQVNQTTSWWNVQAPYKISKSRHSRGHHNKKTSFRSVLIFFANLLFSVSAEVCLGDEDAECDVKNDDGDDGRNDVSADRSGVPLKNDAQDENLWAQVNSYCTGGNVTTNHGRTLRQFAKYQVVKYTKKQRCQSWRQLEPSRAPPGNHYWRGRLSTLDHLVLTSLDWLLLIMQTLFTFLLKQA